MPEKAAITPEIYQLKVTVRHSKPPIWRRMLVSSDTNLGKLHRILQVLFAWEDSHLHQFTAAGRQYSNPMFQLEDVSDERRVKLGQMALGPKSKILYEYDFGDSWEVEIIVEKVLPFDDKQPLPFIVDGKLAGPLEDSGGIWGYMDLVRILNDPSDPRYEERMGWIFGYEEPEEGAHFDAEAFDKDALNKELRSLR
ncbi:MAG: plasmid pRiA4b ORF-3 family protein [Anaerolineae bacterium]|nr:plasmid pRiA4b ORF-3 family protein [Anaerolineae bacterium]